MISRRKMLAIGAGVLGGGIVGLGGKAMAAPVGAQGKPLLWWDAFNTLDTTRWIKNKTSAFPNMGKTNRGDHKLDYLSDAAVTIKDGNLVITATRKDSTYWYTGLVTTERVGGTGFELQQGDYWETKFQLPTQQGAWFSVWTWGRDLSTGVQPGHGEVDVVEWHWNNPDLLELSNHVRSASKYYRTSQISRGAIATLGVYFGGTSCDWYLNNVKIWSDNKGVPSNWRGWPILELSIADGYWHPKPPSSARGPIPTYFHWTRVYR